MATWAMRQRYAWIEARIAAGESFTREDIVRAFTVTKQTASATLREFRELHPDMVRYDGSRKAFVRADAPSAAWMSAPQTGKVRDVLAWLEERSRNSASYGSHADAYEIAARKLREALGLPALVEEAA
jgi:hypothetical protein